MMSVIMRGKNSFVLRAKLSDGTVIALEKGASKSVIKINGKVDTLAACVKRIPVVLIDSHSHRQFFSESAYRRRFVDWCAFHVEQGFLDAYRRYQKGVKNAKCRLEAKKRLESLGFTYGGVGFFCGSGLGIGLCSLNTSLDSPLSYQRSAC